MPFLSKYWRMAKTNDAKQKICSFKFAKYATHKIEYIFSCFSEHALLSRLWSRHNRNRKFGGKTQNYAIQMKLTAKKTKNIQNSSRVERVNGAQCKNLRKFEFYLLLMVKRVRDDQTKHMYFGNVEMERCIEQILCRFSLYTHMQVGHNNILL